MVAKQAKRHRQPASEALGALDLKHDDGWAVAAAEFVAGLGEAARSDWIALLHHLGTITSRSGLGWLQAHDAISWACMSPREELIDDERPSPPVGSNEFTEVLVSHSPADGWTAATCKRAEAIGVDQVERMFGQWLQAARSSRPGSMNNPGTNREMLRGIIWFAALRSDSVLTERLRQLAEHATAKKLHPAVSIAHALALARNEASLAALYLLAQRTRRPYPKERFKALADHTALCLGLSAEDVAERFVPDFEMSEVGLREYAFGAHRAQLVVGGRGRVETRWFRADGSPQKSTPKAVKDRFGAELKELKATAKDVERTLTAQRERIERLSISQRTWPFPVWEKHYHAHHVVGTLARRLIWQFTHEDARAESGAWKNGRFVNCHDEPISGPDASTTVRLWHPLDDETENILGWRDWLMRHEVQQPFKQAHREVYRLTDAERETGTHSNRFAAHILRQHQLKSLCQARGWTYGLLGPWDADNYPHTVPKIDLAEWGLSAEFWVYVVGDAHETTHAGISLHVGTDQVRFYRRGEAEPMPLTQIPPLVLSEILRDVDLFVGVASVGNDPAWQDGGPEGRYRDYWQSYSFGDLSGTAKTRKALLDRLVPRLKIADRCRLDDKFLIVCGDWRTYKIHLGSGNILMEPNDQYLCIVPNAGMQGKAAGKVFLPFEGDRTLSIILSKAFLLAEDAKIKDATILSQIGR